jgi:hypothetical protein
MAGSETKIASNLARHTQWTGRSGRGYNLVSESLDHFAMGDGEVHVIAKGSHVLWVGSTDELVNDPMSRTRFRLALDCADRAFRLLTPSALADRLATIWDLEDAVPLFEAQAA